MSSSTAEQCHASSLWHQHTLPKWIETCRLGLQQATLLRSRGKSSLWLVETGSLWLFYEPSWFLRQVSRKWAVATLLWGLWSQAISRRIGIHGGLLSHEETCWLRRNMRLVYQWLAIRHLGKRIRSLLLLEISRVRAVAMSISIQKRDPENEAKYYLFVCGLNLVGCPSSIELKSTTSLLPSLTILTSEDEGPSLVVLVRETLGEVITFPFSWDEVVAALISMLNWTNSRVAK
jgi:hypothetical protein